MFFCYAGLVLASVGLILAVKGAFRLSGLPSRASRDPRVWELRAAYLLFGIATLCPLTSAAADHFSAGRVATHLLTAAAFIGLAAHAYLRSKRATKSNSGV